MTETDFCRKYVSTMTKKRAVRCNTEKAACQLLALADAFGFSWRDGESFLVKNKWSEYSPHAAYDVAGGQIGNASYMEAKGYEIVTFIESIILQDELCTGMNVQLRNGSMLMYIKPEWRPEFTTDGFLTDFNLVCVCIEDYSNLKHESCRELDIVKVFEVHDVITKDGWGKSDVLWEESDDLIEMTLSEVEDMLNIRNLKIVEEGR